MPHFIVHFVLNRSEINSKKMNYTNQIVVNEAYLTERSNTHCDVIKETVSLQSARAKQTDTDCARAEFLFPPSHIYFNGIE